MKPASLQFAKLVFGFLSGLALLSLFAFHVLLGLTLSDAVQMLILTSAVGSFGLAAHGAYKIQPGGQ